MQKIIRRAIDMTKEQLAKFLQNKIVFAIISAITFMLIFSAIGYFFTVMADGYYKYLDRHEYYTISESTVISKNVQQCGIVDVYIDGFAEYPLQAAALVEVVLVRTDGLESEEITIPRQINIKQGRNTIVAHFQLTCDIPPGQYFLRAGISYKFRGGEHSTAWRTNLFPIQAKAK